MLLFTYNFDASPTARSSWFHNIHVLEAFHLSVIEPSLIVLWEDVSLRCYVVILTMLPLHFENIPPQIIFTSQMPSAWKVIDFLIRVNVFKFACFDEPSPENVPLRASN